MTPEQLKASILQYAIQGKLVEQRPEEGTAEELFQQMMLFSLGLCSMITYKVKVFTEEEIASLLKQQFVANLQYINEHAKD